MLSSPNVSIGNLIQIKLLRCGLINGSCRGSMTGNCASLPIINAGLPELLVEMLRKLVAARRANTSASAPLGLIAEQHPSANHTF